MEANDDDSVEAANGEIRDNRSEGEGPKGQVGTFFDPEVRNPPPIGPESGLDGPVVDGPDEDGVSRLEPSELTKIPPELSPLPGYSGDVTVNSSPIAISSSTNGVSNQTPVLNRGDARQQRMFQPAGLPHYSFVKFSAYRQSLRTFFVNGISSYVARSFDKDKVAHTCEWHPGNGSLPLSMHTDPGAFVETTAEHIYMKSDENRGTYSPTIINCTFKVPVGANRLGGLLVLRISTGYDRWEKNLPILALEEQVNEVNIVSTPPEKIPFKYAFCGAPMHGTVRADWILHWMKYHHYLTEGSAHFFFYNLGGLANSDRPVFNEFINAGLLSITDILDPNLSWDYPTWYFHQVLLINDCLHRSRFMAERVFFFDYDEFLQVPAPDSLKMFMRRHAKEPWISFGSIYANTKDCRLPKPGESETLFERMVWRRPRPECRIQQAKYEGPPVDALHCIGPLGRRKYVANPRKTFAAGVHWVTIPKNGLDLSGNGAHILHYRSAPLPKTRLCSNNVTMDGTDDDGEASVLEDGWIQDDQVSQIFKRAKSYPIVPFIRNAAAGGF